MSNRHRKNEKTAAGDSPASPALETLVADLLRHHHGQINTVLYYGSCLRSNDPFSGIVDLYLITDSYRAFYRDRARAFLNRMLPPNVFYREIRDGESLIRTKYSVLTTADLVSGLSGKRMHSYFWARFSQPIKILWCRDEETRAGIDRCLNQAVKTFLERVLPTAPACGTLRELWEQGFGLTYSAELRSEGPGRAGELVDYALDHFVAASTRVAQELHFPFNISGTGDSAVYSAVIPSSRRLIGRSGWLIRRIYGKFISIARLIKALFTFEGGLDYAVWKLTRHSGQMIEIPDHVRRHPLIYVWPLLWKLYRRGVIR